MRRDQLEHIIRASSSITGEIDIGYVETLLKERMITPAIVSARVSTMQLPRDAHARIHARLGRILSRNMLKPEIQN